MERKSRLNGGRDNANFMERESIMAQQTAVDNASFMEGESIMAQRVAVGSASGDGRPGRTGR